MPPAPPPADHPGPPPAGPGGQGDAGGTATSAFLAQLAHELRTPLMVVMGFADLLGNEPEAGAERARALAQQIRSACLHLLTLTDDLFDLARIESGSLVLALQPLELGALVHEMAAQLQTMAGAAGVVLQAAAAPPVWVRADATRLRQVLYNLLSNAIKYNRAGGSVHVEAEAAQGRGVVHVVDSGIGMSAGQLERLFRPWDRLGREGGPVHGAGLGLSIAHDLVVRMGGELAVTSRPGEGTRVALHLPAAPAPAPAAPAEPAGRLLCVDDNPVNRTLVDAMLAGWPQVVLEFAVDGRSASEAVRARRPDLVLLDLRLPDVDGLAWLAALRRDPALAAIPVVVFTASTDAEIALEARALGALACIGKPVDAAVFRRHVAQWLQGRPTADTH